MPEPIAFQSARFMSTLRVRVLTRRLRASLRAQRRIDRMRQRATRLDLFTVCPSRN
jgi:hypothetical protein